MAYYTDATGAQQALNATAIPASPVWMRIRESSGALYFDWSTDGAYWTNWYSLATPVPVDSLTFGIHAGRGRATHSDPDTTAFFADVNIATSIVPSPPTTGSSRLSVSLPEYSWILCQSPSRFDPFAPLVKVGDLHSAKNRQYQLVRNRAGSASFSLRTNDDLVPEILDNIDLGDVRGTVRHCIRIRRNGVDIWSGPIWGIQGDLDAGTIQFSCVGWLEEAQKRILWTTQDYSNSGAGTRADTIALPPGLLNTINAQDPVHPLLIQPGTATGDFTAYPRNRYYPWGQTVLGPALQELSDIEAGFDYVVDPVTRAVNLSTWDQFANRTDIKLGYSWGPNNLKNVTWQEDAAQTCNFMGITSLGAVPVYVNDPTSEDQYGLFEELNSISNANISLLQPYGVAELVIRSRPLVTYTLTPSPTLQNEGPRLFDDYQIGDKIYWSARKDHFQVLNQAIRVFGATIQLDDNGNETITALQTTPATG